MRHQESCNYRRSASLNLLLENTRTTFGFEKLVLSKTADLLYRLWRKIFDWRHRIYPVVGLDVRIISSSRTLRTDTRGIVQFAEIPVNSRVIVETFDAQGLYVPSKTEAVVEKDGVVRLKCSSRKSCLCQRSLGDFNTAYGSICFNLKNSDGSQGYKFPLLPILKRSTLFIGDSTDLI